jgi:ankyrin repeat protein
LWPHFCSRPFPRAKQNRPPNDLLTKVHDGDRRGVETLLRAGSDPNSRDERGSTALMYATAFSSPDMIQLLLSAGADPRLSDSAGSTALMWATADALRVRFLVDGGADVNAIRPDGVTPLITAALRGNTEVVKILLSAGANSKSGSILAPWPMDLTGIAYTSNDNTLRELLLSKGVPPLRATGEKMGQPSPASPLPLMAWLMTSTFSWRSQTGNSNIRVVRALLDAGANPNETSTQLVLTASVLARVATLGDVEVTRLLLDRGADPNAKGSSGWTPLMAATVSEPSAPIVKVLLEKGARIDLRDDAGRTALDWALSLGENETSRVLRSAGAVAMAPPRPGPRVVETPRAARRAVELALNRLQPAAKEFKDKTPCISCHHQSLPAIAVKVAVDKGVGVDRELAKLPTRETLKSWESMRPNMLIGNCSVFGFVQNVSYGMLGLAEEGVPPSLTTDAVASCLSGLQRSDGSWQGHDSRPPLSGRSPIVYTAMAARGLKMYGPAGRREEMAARVVRARAFLRKSIANGTQDESFKLLGFIWSGASAAEIARQSKKVMQLQRTEGGWGQYPSMTPDAYATGQALYALRASGVAVTSPAYRNGVEYLLRTQGEDGTWYMRSRAMGFQPYVESGFPHGPDQFISSAATSWAVIGLAYSL